MEARSTLKTTSLQAALDAAPNALSKGLAAYFTPPEWARALAIPLPDYRPVVVDLSCGNGQLLAGAGRHPLKLGADIDSALAVRNDVQFIEADLTLLFPLLCKVNWRADLFVLNPPWDLHWHRSRLDDCLLNSDCPAVQLAYLERDPRLGAELIDSTVATLMMALDRMPRQGEGMLIGNQATLDRLLFAPGAPHAALADHVWAHLVVEGNLCQTGKPGSRHQDTFQTGVIYFAREHRRGVQGRATVKDLATATSFLETARARRDRWHFGAECKDYLCTADTAELWSTVAEEMRVVRGQARPPENIWLEQGLIRTYLSLFDEASGRVPVAEIAALHALAGQDPMKLVVMKESRRALQRAVDGTRWRVSPELQAAVRAAVTGYFAERTPLYPLPKIQCLGFLDEHDTIECRQSLGREFIAGQSYALRSRSVHVKRKSVKMNLWGLMDETELDCQELAFFITAESGQELCFMEQRLREESVTVSIIKPGVREALKRLTDADLEPCPIDYNLQELLTHFTVPAVPDVAEVFPKEYAANLALLDEIEQLVNL